MNVRQIYDQTDEYQEEDRREWLITFSDLSLLLLVFFVLLYSMSSLDTIRFKESFESVRRALGVEGENKGTLSIPFQTQTQTQIVSEIQARKQLLEKQNKVFSDVNYYFTEKGLDGLMGANLESGTITIRIPGDVLFDPGAVELSDQAKTVLAELKDVFIRHHDQMINIKGHSDNIQPGKGSRFKDNWEISSMRAVNVLRYFMELNIEANRLTATGLADLKPLFPNNSDENRKRNRRVEIVLERRIGGND